MKTLAFTLGVAAIIGLWRPLVKVLGAPWTVSGLLRWAFAGLVGAILLSAVQSGELARLELPPIPKFDLDDMDILEGVLFVVLALIGRAGWSRRSAASGGDLRLPARRRALPPAPAAQVEPGDAARQADFRSPGRRP